jgi:hypothetical protein
MPQGYRTRRKEIQIDNEDRLTMNKINHLRLNDNLYSEKVQKFTIIPFSIMCDEAKYTQIVGYLYVHMHIHMQIYMYVHICSILYILKVNVLVGGIYVLNIE